MTRCCPRAQVSPNRKDFIRKATDLTQEEFAERLNISRTHMGHIEQGRKQPSLELLQKIAKKLGVKVNELIPF